MSVRKQKHKLLTSAKTNSANNEKKHTRTPPLWKKGLVACRDTALGVFLEIGYEYSSTG